MFPLEIWEIIWKKIDNPAILVQLQKVCKTWYYGIERILPEDGWIKLCENLVPEFWTSVIAKSHCLHVRNLQYNEELCKRIYLSWHNFKNTVRFPRPVERSKINDLLKFSDSERITCIDVWKEILAFSTTEGLLYFCHVNDMTNPFYIADHGQSVMQVRLSRPIYEEVDNDADTLHHLAVSTCVNGHVKFWNFKEGRAIESEGPLGNLIERCTDWDKPKKFFTVWKGILSQCEYNFSSIRSLWKYEFLPPVTNETIVLISSIYKTILTFDDETNTTKVYRVSDMESDYPPRRELVRSYSFPADCASSSIKKFYMLSRCVIACITDHLVTFSFFCDDWVPYNMHERLGGNVRSVCASGHGSCLVMGLDTGDVYVFHTHWDLGWAPFDFSPSNATKIIRFKSGPIVFLTLFDNKYIIAATQRSIHVHKMDLQ